jgi:hypothetical protein
MSGCAANDKKRRLAALSDLVRTIESALKSQDYRRGRPAANELAATTGRWIDEIQHDPAIDAELTAALKVFRNAAFAFRQLSKASRGAKNITMASTCATLIAQGNDLLLMYLDRRGDQGNEV